MQATMDAALTAWETLQNQARGLERQIGAADAPAHTLPALGIQLAVLQLEADRLFEVVLEQLRAHSPGALTA